MNWILIPTLCESESRTENILVSNAYFHSCKQAYCKNLFFLASKYTGVFNSVNEFSMLVHWQKTQASNITLSSYIHLIHSTHCVLHTGRIHFHCSKGTFKPTEMSSGVICYLLLWKLFSTCYVWSYWSSSANIYSKGFFFHRNTL